LGKGGIMPVIKKPGKVGKPPINNPEDKEAIQQKIDAYFESLIDEEGKEIPPTFCGLSLALGYCDRSTLWRASTSDTPISQPIKKAMLRIEAYAERKAYSSNPAGAIFIMKNRGWTDKSESVLSGDITVNKRELSKLTDKELEALAIITSKIENEPTDT